MKFFLIVISIILAGCVTTTSPRFTVQVDSISAPTTNELKKYIIFSANKDTTIDDLQFIEYAGYVDRALLGHGFIKAKDFNDANVAVFLAYGIGEPQTKKYTYSIPIWGQTGVSSSKTNSTINVYGNSATVRSNTTHTPTYGVTGTTTSVKSYTTFTRYLTINALDLDEYKINEKQKKLWRTTVISTGSSADLRQVFPVLVAASKPYISQNTGKKIEVIIKENDEQVLQIKGIQTNK